MTKQAGLDGPIAARVGSGAAQYPKGPSVLSARHYTDAEQYERELENIFHEFWLCACPVADIARMRDYVVWEQFGQSVVIVRTDGGDLVAWHNVCQHRGARLMKESGRCATGSFECPWHGFSYDLEGRVVHVPLRETFDEKQLKGLRIPLVHVREWAAFVWISLSAEPPPFEAFLGELKPELDAYALSTGEARYRHEWRIGANWKTVVDASLEVLHVPITHKNTVKEGSLLWRDAALKIFQPHSMMVIPMRKQDEDSAPVEETHRKTMLCQYLAFPSTIFSCRPDRVQTFTAWPAGPRDTVLQAWGFAPPPPEGEDAETWRAKNDIDWSHFCALVEDDVNVLAEAGRVYDTLGFKRNLFAAAEGRLTAFHEAVNELTATSA